MKIYCFSAGDPSVEIPISKMVVDVVGFKLNDIDDDNLKCLITDIKKVAENFFNDKVTIMIEEEIERLEKFNDYLDGN